MELLGLGDLEGGVGEDKVCHRRRRHSIVYLLLFFVVLACTPCSYVQLSLSCELPAQNDKWKLSLQCNGNLRGKAMTAYFHKDIMLYKDLVSVRPHAPPDNPSP